MTDRAARDYRSQRSAALGVAALAAVVALPAGTIAASARDDDAAAARVPGSVEPLAASQSTGILGKKIVGPSGEDLGMVVDVIVDHDGRPLAAVIDFGGFLGVGSRKIAVEWNLLRFEPGAHGSQIVLNIGRRELQDAPEYKANAASTEMVGPPLVGPSFFRGDQ